MTLTNTNPVNQFNTNKAANANVSRYFESRRSRAGEVGVDARGDCRRAPAVRAVDLCRPRPHRQQRGQPLSHATISSMSRFLGAGAVLEMAVAVREPVEAWDL
jgi:hypothetical protein